MSTNEIIDVVQVKNILTNFLDNYAKFVELLNEKERSASKNELRHKLQRMEPQVTQLIVNIIGEGSFTIGDRQSMGQISHSHLIASALMGGANESWYLDDFKERVELLINRAIGAIEANLWPPKESKPILIINDRILKGRCFDL